MVHAIKRSQAQLWNACGICMAGWSKACFYFYTYNRIIKVIINEKYQTKYWPWIGYPKRKIILLLTGKSILLCTMWYVLKYLCYLQVLLGGTCCVSKRNIHFCGNSINKVIWSFFWLTDLYFFASVSTIPFMMTN